MRRPSCPSSEHSASKPCFSALLRSGSARRASGGPGAGRQYIDLGCQGGSRVYRGHRSAWQAEHDRQRQRPMLEGSFHLVSARSRNGRYSVPVLMTACATRAIFGGECSHRLAAAIGVIGMPCDVSPSLSRKLLSRCRMATWVAIQNVRRRRALPYFESLVRPRNVPDWRVARLDAEAAWQDMMSVTGGGIAIAVFDAKSCDWHFLDQANESYRARYP